MRKTLLLAILFLAINVQAGAEYVDHRGHNVDSLESVMARRTAMDIENADDDQLRNIVDDLEGLMLGFNQTNGVKSEYYARMMLRIASRKGWHAKVQMAAKGIGQHFWAKEQFDSAAFYYSVAMKAVNNMSPENTDDALSQMYGTLGNLYSMMDSVDIAMDYYEKAGELFRKNGWKESCSVLYYNMGETMRENGNLDTAERYYLESLDYSMQTGDSLAIATSYKGLGSLYLDMNKTGKAIKYLNEANIYFAQHEDEELQSRMESLDYTSQVLAMQKKRMKLLMILLAAGLMMTIMAFLLFLRLKKTTKEKNEIVEVLEETVESISPAAEKKDVELKPREREVLDLVAKGYTNAQIAEALNLSTETIKWYKKKLFVIFDASNSAELVRIAKDEGIF